MSEYEKAVFRDALAKLVEIRDVRDFEFLLPSEADALIRFIENLHLDELAAEVLRLQEREAELLSVIAEVRAERDSAMARLRPHDAFCVLPQDHPGECSANLLADSNWCKRPEGPRRCTVCGDWRRGIVGTSGLCEACFPVYEFFATEAERLPDSNR